MDVPKEGGLEGRAGRTGERDGRGVGRWHRSWMNLSSCQLRGWTPRSRKANLTHVQMHEAQCELVNTMGVRCEDAAAACEQLIVTEGFYRGLRSVQLNAGARWPRSAIDRMIGHTQRMARVALQ